MAGEDARQRLEALLDHAAGPLVLVGSDGTVRFASPAAERFLGDHRHHPLDAVDPRDRGLLRRRWRELLEDDHHGTRQALVQARRADGRDRDLDVTLLDLRGVAQVDGVVVTARDITDELAVRARLEHQTTHDGLTGLANRTLLMDELRSVGATGVGALLLLNIVGMSAINDRIGHATGDLLLRAVGERLAARVAGSGMVARTSGDEFAVLLPKLRTDAAAARIAYAMLRSLEDPIATPGGGSIRVNARIGIALVAASDGRAAGVFSDADLALDAVRRSATDAVRICDDGLRSRQQRRLTIEHDLRRPEVLDELWLAYQPIVNLDSGAVECLEVLLRWDHPSLGAIGPAEFIPIAEHTGTISRIGRNVLDRALAQLTEWDAAGISTGLRLAVNVSARQLMDPQLAPTVADALERSRITGARLSVEITETALADDHATTNSSIEALTDLGVQIHIDDFGTGYASFAQLLRFPFHGLKIDRSFVRRLGADAQAEAIVASLLAVGRAGGQRVIAEGVETADELIALRELGCELGQGYWWSPPLAPHQVPELLTDTRMDVAP